MAKREFVMLAQKYNPTKCWVTDWYMSEKLDGERCFWDGGISRGIPKLKVPWANITKDDRYVKEQIATGMWTRYGHVRHAPEWFLDTLPITPLDGELFSTTMSRQKLFSILKRNPENMGDWSEIDYNIFDSPSFDQIFGAGAVDACRRYFDYGAILSFINERGYEFIIHNRSFEETLTHLSASLSPSSVAIIHPQERLSIVYNAAMTRINERVAEIIAKPHGEGVILRSPKSRWFPERSWNLLKVKKADDMEGTVIGYTTGRETDKGSKLLGKIGALILKLENEKTFKLSGFNTLNGERDFATLEATNWAIEHPNMVCHDWITSNMFPVGSRITFTYRGLTDEGIPIEARYLRPRPEGE